MASNVNNKKRNMKKKFRIVMVKRGIFNRFLIQERYFFFFWGTLHYGESGIPIEFNTHEGAKHKCEKWLERVSANRKVVEIV